VLFEHFNIRYYSDCEAAFWLACTAMYREPACLAQFVERLSCSVDKTRFNLDSGKRVFSGNVQTNSVAHQTFYSMSIRGSVAVGKAARTLS